jgi:hypothetical protein
MPHIPPSTRRKSQRIQEIQEKTTTPIGSQEMTDQDSNILQARELQPDLPERGDRREGGAHVEPFRELASESPINHNHSHELPDTANTTHIPPPIAPARRISASNKEKLKFLINDK